MMKRKKSRGSILALSVLLFAFEVMSLPRLAIANAFEDLPVPPLNKENYCNYTVTIETTCTRGADTSNLVSLRFGDTKSNDIIVRRLNSKHVRRVDPLDPTVLDDVPRKPFQACTVDQFQVRGLCVESPICYIYLKLRGSDDWRPGLARVHVLGAPHLSSDYYYFRRYLPRHVWHGFDTCDKELTPFGMRYKRKVFPTNKAPKSIPILPP
ncbi:embryo-specific protein ATS3A-like [Macadamia integrifolia]|uniref:embryo-specific protein ATS3A-like n=1 Tax=Macadamia integrifolia TaxID=60698 RepID=UPI001C4FCCFC|nr:embryo-specific protein ATS3A-like [Macadamia integrifolia]